MTNVDGVLDKNKNLIKSATKAEINALIADGTISGGMLPKVDCCLKALELGVREVKIVNANSNKLNGTRIRQFEKQLFYVDLANFEPTGNTRHYKNSGLLPKPVALEIIQYPDPDSSNGYYLFYLDETGFEQTDTYHDTIEQAFAQAEFEFNVKPSDWTKID